jgi:hypothetical protein
VLFAHLHGSRPIEYDCYNWNDRTYKVAHKHIIEHFDELEDGAVIDVEYILGETEAPKKSESESP